MLNRKSFLRSEKKTFNTMASHRKWLLLALAWSLVASLEATSKYYTDENRPYEFGFTVNDNEQKQQTQHRHEKKDENGIIMGEYGFLTADGVYHVTVYATDEDGNFKILSTKNLRSKPFPTVGDGKSPKAKSLSFPKSTTYEQQEPQAPVQVPQPVPQAIPSRRAFTPPSEADPIKSCSSCSIPTSPKPELTDLAVVSRDDQPFPQYPDQPPNPRARQFVPGMLSGRQADQRQQLGQGQQAEQKQHAGQEHQSGQEHQAGQGQQRSGQGGQSGQTRQPESIGERNLQGDISQNPGRQQFEIHPGSFYQGPSQTDGLSGLNYQQLNQKNLPSVPKPKLISAQIQLVDGNTDVNKLNPGEKAGLPSGLKEDDMLQLLYTFNYTVGFHAHHEEGYTDGVKKGYYYVTGRNGVRTRIDYVADSGGFHPKISTDVLDLLSEDVPKLETEREDKYGLKGYEFKWLFFPPKSSRLAT